MTPPSSRADGAAPDAATEPAGSAETDRSREDRYTTEPQGQWPPDGRTVQLFVFAMIALAGPWIWWALR